MSLTRRRFIRNSTALGAASGAAAVLGYVAPTAAEAAAGVVASSPAATPSPAVIALNRMGYGPRPGDIERVAQIGLAAYISEQLAPASIDDRICDEKIAQARLRIDYNTTNDGTPRDPAYPNKRAAENLGALYQSVDELWKRARGDAPYQDGQERRRPADEVRVATWIRAVYSKRQLYELLVEFWHNHFNVNRNTTDEVAAMFSLYDGIMRVNALGNFRQMLEQVAKSVAMMYYLNNINNRQAGGEGPNENYARELFELHTLGSDNYLRFYDDRRNIGTTTYGGVEYARGYIDDDVYEAAGCLTGWSIGNGRDGRPNTGQFHFVDNWHDNGAKIILSTDGTETVAKNGGEDDGYKLLDMLAGHPGTARFVCGKLCRRLLGDSPPSNVVDAAVAMWMATTTAADQLAQVVGVILSSAEFATTWGSKLKRPFEFIVSYIRATGAELPVDTDAAGYWNGLIANYSLAGQRLFEWATPTGHPDLQWYWLSSNSLLRRWNLPFNLTQSYGGNVQIDLASQTDLNASCSQIVDFWTGRLFGYSISASSRQELIDFLARGGDPTKKPIPTQGEPNDPNVVKDRVVAMVHLMAMSPDYQIR